MRTETVVTSDLAHDLRVAVGRIIRRLRAEPGPAMPQLTVLGRLDRRGPASVSELAAAERMRPQSMAQTVRDLEGAGFVTRRADPDDGRRALVELTDAGMHALRVSRAHREGWLTETLERDFDEHERELLRDAVALLERIADG
jgi:DNA-binding MarR family transcriptional regulator